MSPRLVVIGIGGFGRETLDVVESLDTTATTSTVVVDDDPNVRDLVSISERGFNYIGTIDSWLSSDYRDDMYVIAVGSPLARRAIYGRVNTRGCLKPAPALIHPSATIGTHATLSHGVVVCPGAIISNNVSVGAHTHINPGAIVGHDTSIDAFVSVNPGAVLSGNVSIATSVLVGANSTVLQGISVRAGATIGASACVTRDLPSGAIAKGVPATW